MTTPPRARTAGEQLVDSTDDDVSAFVFKIQANMNKAHRDRIAFMRLVSGRFDADKEVYQDVYKRQVPRRGTRRRRH